jgi:hypothetical protein
VNLASPFVVWIRRLEPYWGIAVSSDVKAQSVHWTESFLKQTDLPLNLVDLVWQGVLLSNLHKDPSLFRGPINKEKNKCRS